MPNNINATTIHGVSVRQIQLQGKWYTTVDDRVKIAQRADVALIRAPGKGYHVASVQIIQIGDRWAYHCMVEYPVGSGILTPGTDFIDTKDSSGVAKAETSAIGRALGLHGIAIEESIASAEEVEASGTTENGEGDTPYQTTFPKYSDAELRAKSRALYAELDLPEADYADLFYKAIGKVKSPDRITREDGDKWFAHLVRMKSDRVAEQEQRELDGLKKMRAKIAPNSPEVVDFEPEPGQPDAPLSFPSPDAPLNHDLRTLGATGTRAN